MQHANYTHAHTVFAMLCAAAVCLGAPDAALLDKSRGVWPSSCADHTLTAGECKAIVSVADCPFVSRLQHCQHAAVVEGFPPMSAAVKASLQRLLVLTAAC